MQDEEQPHSDPLATEILVQLIRNGSFDLTDVQQIAARLDECGFEGSAHRAMGAFIEAGAEDAPRADVVVQLVPRMRLGPDGGNDGAA